MALNDALAPEDDLSAAMPQGADDTLTSDPEVDSALKEYMQPADVPTPSAKGAKFLKYNDDGSALFESNGQKINYYRGDGHITWEDGGKKYLSKSPLLKPTVIGVSPKTPDAIATEAAARKGVVPEAYTTPEEYKKARSQALNPNALGADVPQDAVGDEALSGLSEQDKATVKKMANYEWPIPPGGIRNPKQLALLQRATVYDPSFSPSEYTIRQKSKMDYTSGKSYNNARSLNTLAGHLDNLSRSADGLGNTDNAFGNTIGYNTIGNWVLNRRGDPRVKTFNADVNAVTNELGQLLKGGAVTDQEAKHWRETIDSSESPAQLHAVIKEFADIAKSRLDALQQGYEGVMRKPADIQIMSPKAKASFMKLGVLSKEDVENTPGGAKGFGAQPVPSAAPSATPLRGNPDAESIKEAYRAGKITEEQAIASLKALGQ